MNDYGAPFTGSIRKVREEWTDYNGHFNMAYYAVLFDLATDDAFDLIGLGPDYARTTQCSFYTLEAHISYLSELHAGDEVKVTVQLLDYDDKRMHYVQQMFHAPTGRLAATLEALCTHVDMRARRSSPWPQDIRDRIAAMYEAHKDLAVPPQVGSRIGIRRQIA